MSEKKRLNIGYFIHHLENDYSRAIMKGVVPAAEDFDVNLFIYPGRALKGDFYDEKYAVYEYQHNVLYNYASPYILDGLIISAGTIGSFVSKEEFRTFIDRFEGIPILTVENRVRGIPCLRFGSGGINLAVNHLVREHGCKRIAFVGGPKGNSDADSRLTAYMNALEENGLEPDEKLFAFGNFSEYSAKAVGEMLDNCGDPPDAICFANDSMCVGGYEALRERGLEPGKDVLVTGYDDSEVATSLEPQLTTVRADAAVLGYTAVESMYKWLSEGIVPESRELSSALAVRSSCGCTGADISVSKLYSMIANMDTDETAHTIVNILAGNTLSRKSSEMRSELADFISDVLSSSKSGGEIPETKLCGKFRNFLDDNDTVDIIGYDVMVSILETAQTAAMGIGGKISGRQVRIMHLFEKFYRILSENIISFSVRRHSDVAFCYYLISNITKDMMLMSDDENKCFYAIINNLYRIHIKSCYIYTYEKPVPNAPDSQWIMPDKLYLKAYSHGNDLHSPAPDEQAVEWKEYAFNKFVDDSHRRTVVLSALYSNDIQYGVMLCELDLKDFSYVYSIAPQVCAAIRMTGLLKGLEGSLMKEKSTNDILNRISVSDELTGVFNRRGFYKYANEEIKKNQDTGKTAVLIFADLDNLKKINDTFGHDDGDYAIISAAGFLKKGLNDSGVAARIGGDEFAALAIPNDGSSAEDISARIKKIAAEHNLKSEKPYNVTVSIGTFTFICSDGIRIQDLMDKADEALYADKKNKNHDIMKK